jgi:hypothetical protein
MSLEFEPVPYNQLNPPQQENYNYHKVSARLADYGYTTIRLHDDFEGADFISKHVRGKEILKVQLKGRVTFDTKYHHRDEDEDPIYIAFRDGEEWYLYPHDELFDKVTDELDIIKGTQSWEQDGTYHIGTLSDAQERILEAYRIPRLDGSVS